MMRTTRLRIFKVATAAAVATLLTTLAGCAHHRHHGGQAMPAQAVRIAEPVDGATVGSPFKLRFATHGMAVAPAGDIVANSGHHHLLVNLDAVPAGESVPFTPQHLHFGQGQTETEVTLPPGRYRLTAQFANGAHQSYGAAMAHTVRVTVK